MKIFIKNYLFLIICVLSLFVGCSERGGASDKNTYLLINDTNELLYYETRCSYNNTVSSFKISLNPNDTLPLYTKQFIPPDDFIEEHTPFYGYVIIEDEKYAYISFYTNEELIIKSDNETVLFYGSDKIYCGEVNFVSDKKKGHNYHYWIIDSDYIDNKSCNMSWEELEKEE
jgi:hypothetical protein